MHRDELNKVPMGVTALEKQAPRHKTTWLNASSKMLGIPMAFNGNAKTVSSDFGLFSTSEVNHSSPKQGNVRHAATFSAGMEATSSHSSGGRGSQSSGVFSNLVGSMARGARDTLVSLSGMFGLASGHRHGRIEPGGKRLTVHAEGTDGEESSDRSMKAKAAKSPPQVSMLSERMKSAPLPFDSDRVAALNASGPSRSSFHSTASKRKAAEEAAAIAAEGKDTLGGISSLPASSSAGKLAQLSEAESAEANKRISNKKSKGMMEHVKETGNRRAGIAKKASQEAMTQVSGAGGGDSGRSNRSDSSDGKELKSISHVGVRGIADAKEMLTTSRGSLNVDGTRSRHLPNLLLVDKFESMLDTNIHVMRSEVQTIGKKGKRFWHLVDNINSWSFDIFRFQKLCGNQALLVVSNVLFCRHSFDQTLNVDKGKFTNFISMVQDGYCESHPRRARRAVQGGAQQRVRVPAVAGFPVSAAAMRWDPMQCYVTPPPPPTPPSFLTLTFTHCLSAL